MAVKGHSHIFKTLIAAGAEIDAADNDGWTALHLAALSAQPREPASAARVPMHPHCGKRRTECASSARAGLFLDCVASRGHAQTVELLIAKGADKSIKNKEGMTALGLADKEEVKGLLRWKPPSLR